MSTGINIVWAALISVILCITASAAAKRPGEVWSYYHFDGRNFVAGQPDHRGPSVAVRDRTRPVVSMQTSLIEAVELPPGKGAVAGVCYLQSSGGKLSEGPRFAASPRFPVRIVSAEALVETIQADDQGYFVAVLDAGTYRIGNAPFSVEIRVKKGTTTLVPLRTGKRMVD